MVAKMIKYVMITFYPDEKGFFKLPEDSIGAEIHQKGSGTIHHITALIPIEN